jgi:hypothetical protein
LRRSRSGCGCDLLLQAANPWLPHWSDVVTVPLAGHHGWWTAKGAGPMIGGERYLLGEMPTWIDGR